MPPRRRPAPPALPPALDSAAVEDLSRQVAEGGRPRVVLLSGSAGLPAGTRGTVVRVGDPAEGAEHITVRVDKDELPFAPSELTVAGRGTSQAVEQATAAQAAAPPARRRAPVRASSAATRAAPTPARASVRRSAPEAAPAPTATPAAAAPAPSADAPSPGARAAVERADAGRGRRRAGGTGVPTVTLTLRFADGEWTLDAERGSKRVGRRRPLAAGAVKDAAAALGDDAVDALVAETLDAHRAEVESRAAALRAELAALEATLHRLDG